MRVHDEAYMRRGSLSLNFPLEWNNLGGGGAGGGGGGGGWGGHVGGLNASL